MMNALMDTADRLYLSHVAELEGRYSRVLADHGWDGVAIHSGSIAKRSAFDDQTWPLRPVPHWQHWSPLAEPDCALVVRAGRKPTLVRAAVGSFWEKPAPPESEAFLEAFDVVAIGDPSGAREHVGGGRVAFVGEDVGRAISWGIDRANVCPPDLMAALDVLRVTKTDYEVACIAEANRRARVGHEALRDAFGGGDASELDLHLYYLRATVALPAIPITLKRRIIRTMPAGSPLGTP